MMKFLLYVVRLLLSLRYKIQVQGVEKLDRNRLKRDGGIVFLPNHPAEIDPVILISLLWNHFHPRPLVVEHFYFMRGLGLFMKIVKALPLPSIIVSNNRWKLKQVQKLLESVFQGINKKDNFLIYPGGRLKLSGSEAIGGASLVHSIVQACPNANLVFIRTTGLWGSRFSRALTGTVPSFWKVLLEGFKIVLKNGIFFTPRRLIKIEIEAAPSDFPYSADRLEMNRYLEQWYNRYPTPGPEPLKLVSDLFWKKSYPKVVQRKTETAPAAAFEISALLEKKINEELARLSHRPIDQIKRQLHLSYDLGLDSLDISELYLFLEEQCNVHHLQFGELQTVEDLLKAATGSLDKKGKAHIEVPQKWKKSPRNRPAPFEPMGRTVMEAFLLAAQKMGNCIACADQISGVLNYRKVKIAVLLLSNEIKRISGEHVGILLPSSAAANITVLATLFAGKTPVMLNWTVGTRALDHAAEITGIKTVLSSYRFLSRLEIADLGKIEDSIVLLEDIKKSLNWKDKLKSLFLCLMQPKKLLSFLKLSHVGRENPAVILFTSGTETLPKGVPLSHSNLLSNQQAAMSCVHFKQEDCIYSVLPPFHSFGFSVTGLLPLLSGFKAFYAPDPTDAHGMIADIKAWKPTLFCSAPSFFKPVFKLAGPHELDSVRLFVAGGEKTPEDLFQFVDRLGAHHKMIEGYGITECSPIVTINRPEDPRVGVGRPVPGVELCVINEETLELLKDGEEGEVCIRGPNVFNGYLGGGPACFITVQDKKWYRSGDRGKVDPRGNLILSGRLKRFVKIGGEIISLTALEEEIEKMAIEKGWLEKNTEAPSLAISVLELETERPQIILYTTLSLAPEAVNSGLKEKGFGRIAKISAVKKIETIPLTGTGKVHYRLLEEMNKKS